jgi:hypothetical protein
MPAKKGSKTPPAKKAPPKGKVAPPPAKAAPAPSKLAAPPPAAKKSPPGQRRPAAKPKPSKSAAAARAARTHLAGGEDRKSKLGRKWMCFECGAKFYDLNHPEPLCPKCGTDQRTRPKNQPLPTSPPPPPRPRDHRPLALLDDDDATRDDEALGPEDLDLEFAGIADDEDLGEAPDLGIGEEEEEPAEEE